MADFEILLPSGGSLEPFSQSLLFPRAFLVLGALALLE
jgi:hypothetical protein